MLLNTVYHPVLGQAPPDLIRAASAPDLRETFVGTELVPGTEHSVQLDAP